MSLGTSLQYLQSFSGISYPFVDGQTLLDTSGNKIVYDAIIVGDSSDLPLYSQIQLISITIGSSGVVTSITMGVSILPPSGGGSSFGAITWTAGSSTHVTWGTYWTITNFRIPYTNVLVRFVTSSSAVAGMYTGLTLNFVNHCVQIRPQRLDTLTVVDTDSDISYKFGDQGTSTTIDNVKLASGYNLQIKDTTSTSTNINSLFPNNPNSAREQHAITLDCIPGYGLGRHPSSCTDGLQLNTINSTPPDSKGNFVLNLKDCYWVEKLVTSLSSITGDIRSGSTAKGSLSLHNNCSPCASCQDYYNLYSQLTGVYQKAQILNQRIVNAVRYYNSALNNIGAFTQVVDAPSIQFTFVQTSHNLYSVKFTLNTGSVDMDGLTITFSLPSGYSSVPKLWSGWSRISNQTITRPLLTTEPPISNGIISYTVRSPVQAYFNNHTTSMWQWSFFLLPIITPVNPGTNNNNVVFTMTASGHSVTGSTISFPTQTRNATIRY